MKTQTPPTKSHLTTGPAACAAGNFSPKHSAILLLLLALLAVALPARASSYTWNVANGNWSTPTNWTPNTGVGGPLATDSLTFGNNFTTNISTGVNNVVDAGFVGTITNLTYNSAALPGSFVYDVTQIGAGQTLTVAGNLLVGGVNGPNNANTTWAYMVGGGTLMVTATNLMVQNYDNTTRAGATADFILSGLTNFVYANTNGTIRIEDRLPSDGTDTGLGGNMSLAAVSNKITAATLNLGTSTSAQAGAAGSLGLGAGTNIINASTINISAQKSTFAVTNSGGGLRIRGISGADSDSSVNITIGNKNVGGGSGTITGSLLLNGSSVDIKAGTLIVGANTGGTPNGSGDSGVGVLQFDTGTISANSVIMADNTSANQPAAASCFGTIDVGAHATLLIGAGQLFDLASATASGASTGALIISNGLVNCQGPIAMGPGVGTLSGSIVFLTGGTLNMGPNSYVGVVTNPITSLTLTNCTLSVSIPSVSYTNICVNTLNWPTPDTGLTISVAAMPAGIVPGAVFPLLNFTTMNGAFVNPTLSLPAGVLGYLSLAPGGNTIYLTITAGVGPGTGGVNDLLNSSFENLPLGTSWTTTGGATVVTTNVANTYPNTGGCTVDTRPVQVLNGTNAAKLTGSFVAGGSTNSWSQSVAMAAGTSLTAGGFTYVAHEDMMSGKDSFYYELDFKNASGALVGSYQSTIVTNLTCGGPNIIPLDSWALMAVTNQMQVTGGINTGVVVSNIPSGVIIAPPQTATAQFKAVLVQRNATDSGSVYFDGVNLGFLANPVPPTLSAVTPNLITFCTNTTLSCTASSAETTITSVQVITQTTTLGGTVTTIATNTLTSPYVSGLGTASATVSFPLATNVMYPALIVRATDADGITVSATNTLDTLVPALVVEASDFNFSNGQFFDTPADGGVALYTNEVGSGSVDENKVGRTGEAESYYRPGDAVIIQAAAPGSGAPPSSTEQKFVTAAADGDTNDIELEVGYNSAGDWLNYSRTFGLGGSAPAGTYNVWCYLATQVSGVQSTFSQLTSDPTQSPQTTNFLGYFGTSAFTDSSYNTFVYVPLVDQFGNRVSLTITNGVQTFKNTIVGNPNIGFFLFAPVAPVFTPVLQNISPNGSVPFQSSGQFTFTVGPANGNPINTNSIGLVLNGVPITSGLTFTRAGGSWTVTYAIASNEVYTAVINVTNTAGLSSTYTTSFDTFNVNNFQWEAVDYDFSTNNGSGWISGLFIDNSVPTGDLTSPSGGTQATNSYFAYPTGFSNGNDPYGLGAVAQQGVDINYAALPAGVTPAYRADTVGTEIATDYLRPKFLEAQTNFGDYTICPFDAGYFNGGNWLNYTRTYPTNFFHVWGRLAGGNGAFSGTTLGFVTSGVGTPTQTTNILGSFADPNPAGWQTYHWVPLLDASGNPVVVGLNGKSTLRVTSGNNLNAEFFMLVPVAAPPVVPALVGGALQMGIATLPGHTYTFQATSSLTGTPTTVGTIIGDGTVQTFTAPPMSGSEGFIIITDQKTSP